MTCNDYRPLLSAHLDRQLSAEDHKEVTRHLESCPGCQFESKALLALKEALRQQPMPTMPAGLMADIEAKTLYRRVWWEVPRQWSRGMTIGFATAAALGAWMFLRHHHGVHIGPPLEVVSHPTLQIQEHPRMVMHHDSSSEESPDCQDKTRGC